MTLDKKLNDAFEEMMKYRQSIGYATATYRSSVPPFINFCVKNHPLSARITQEMVDEWLIIILILSTANPSSSLSCGSTRNT